MSYLKSFKKYGKHFKALQWHSKAAATKRYQKLVEDLDLEGKTILDVGCGFADIIKQISKQTKNFEYTGVDIIPEFITEAKKSYPRHEFLVRDYFKSPIKKKFDIVLGPGETKKFFLPFAKYPVVLTHAAFNWKVKLPKGNFEEGSINTSMIIAKRIKNPVLDGKLSEWQGHKSSELNSQKQLIRGKWKGPKDCSAKFKVAYDNKFFYIAVEMEDDVYLKPANPRWRNDSLELFFSTLTAKNPNGLPMRRLNASVATLKENKPYFKPLAMKPEGASAINGKTSRTLEMRFPLESLKLSSGQKTFGFDLKINDIDDLNNANKINSLTWAGNGNLVPVSRRSNAVGSLLGGITGLLGAGVAYFLRIAPVGAAYKAKVLASGVFVGGRKPEDLLAEGLPPRLESHHEELGFRALPHPGVQNDSGLEPAAPFGSVSNIRAHYH